MRTAKSIGVAFASSLFVLVGTFSGVSTAAPPNAAVSFTHKLAADAEYYTTGPQQARPPEGTLKKGTPVILLREAGSYAQVRTDKGVTGFVFRTSLQPISQKGGVSLAESSGPFAIDMYQQLRQTPGNIIFSPASIHLALAMTMEGARGKTESEMAEVLRLTGPRAATQTAMSQLIEGWNQDHKGYQLRVANRLWGQRGFQFADPFLGVTEDIYKAPLETLDFQGDAESSRQTINQWIEKQTEDKIQELIPRGVLDASTRLVLTNAVYFKGDWQFPFAEKNTDDQDFHLTLEDKASVPMMHLTHSFRYAEDEKTQILELPYVNGSLRMLVVLPKARNGLAELEAVLTYDLLASWSKSLKSRDVIVSLPRFKTTSSFSLKDKLARMGMSAAFDPGGADFSGMSESEKLFVSAVVHKGFIDVSEKGTEAAAATGVIVSRTSVQIDKPKPVVFQADQPFLFFIHDRQTGSIVFMGRVMDPR